MQLSKSSRLGPYEVEAPPRWSSDGRRIYFRRQGRAAVAAVHAGESFSAEAPRTIKSFGEITELTVAKGGTIVALREIDSDSTPVTVIFNRRGLLRQ
jgi:hypothetical protein